jgi:hypothetical protein
MCTVHRRWSRVLNKFWDRVTNRGGVPGWQLQCAGCEPELEHSNRNLNLIPCRQYYIEPFIFCAIRRSNNVQWTLYTS